MNDRMKCILLFAMISISLVGQKFQYKASVNEIKDDGFYKIALSPEITAHLHNGFADIRLFGSNAEVPYLLHKENAVTQQEFFVEYDIIEIEHFKNRRYTRIVIHNADKNEIDNIVLRVKNADVKKNLKLNASNNNKDWYVLKDHYDYNSIAHRKKESEIRVLNFPTSNYEYYEILIDDFRDQPIYVEQAGYYDLVKENGQYTELENLLFTQQDTLKETVIAVPLRGNYIDKITFDVKAPKYYHRKASLYTKRIRKGKKSSSSYTVTQKQFELISNSSNTLYLKGFKEDTVFIRIENKDDAALNIQGIYLFQLNNYITAELLAKETYTLKFADREAKRPNYDLKYFADNIPQNILTINTGVPQQLFKSEQKQQSGNANIQDYWLWICVIVVGFLLFYMSYKMVKDKKDS